MKYEYSVFSTKSHAAYTIRFYAFIRYADSIIKIQIQVHGTNIPEASLETRILRRLAFKASYFRCSCYYRDHRE